MSAIWRAVPQAPVNHPGWQTEASVAVAVTSCSVWLTKELPQPCGANQGVAVAAQCGCGPLLVDPVCTTFEVAVVARLCERSFALVKPCLWGSS